MIDKTKNSKVIAIKQTIAFTIDLFLVSLPLIIVPSLETFPIFTLLWFIYIPLSEFYFSKTIGMSIVGTTILSTQDTQTRVSFGTIARRHIARISMVWGVVGWFLMFFSKQYIADYAIVDKNYSSIQHGDEGWVKVHSQNQYKVIFFVLFLIMIFSYLKGVI